MLFVIGSVFRLNVMMILATITLTFSLNNVILLINFLSMITIFGIELSVSNIEITLLIFVIYELYLLCLFLVNGILLMSSLSFNYRIFPYSFSLVIINNWLVGFVLERWIFCLSFCSLNFIPSNCWISFGIFFVYLFQSINYLDSNSSLFLYFPFSSTTSQLLIWFTIIPLFTLFLLLFF